MDLYHVSATERLTRYLDEKKKFSSLHKRAKVNAFAPPSNLKLSIYRTDEFSDAEIWKLGDDYVASIRGKAILARADLLVTEFTNRGLVIDPNMEPHERHANVVNWPQDDESCLRIATELANAAEVIVRPV